MGEVSGELRGKFRYSEGSFLVVTKASLPTYLRNYSGWFWC